MTAVGGTTVGFVDLAKTRDPKGGIARIANILSQDNDWTRYAVWKESNKDTCEQYVIQTSLPDAYWVQPGKGVAISKATTAQIQEGWGILETRNEIPRHIAMREPNIPLFRMTQDDPAVEALRQKAALAFIYGNAGVHPEQFTGIAPRYASTTGGTGSNVIIAAKESSPTESKQTSCYIVKWAPERCYMFTPKGSGAGIDHTDLGMITLQNQGGTDLRMEAYSSVFNWGLGLAVQDWRHIVRVADIDTLTLAALSGNQASTSMKNVLHAILLGLARLPKGPGRTVLHGNRTLYAGLLRLAMEKSSAVGFVNEAAMQFGNVEDPQLLVFGKPFVIVDQIVDTEAIVS